jgi:hypothetical protein
MRSNHRYCERLFSSSSSAAVTVTSPVSYSVNRISRILYGESEPIAYRADVGPVCRQNSNSLKNEQLKPTKRTKQHRLNRVKSFYTAENQRIIPCESRDNFLKALKTLIVR